MKKVILMLMFSAMFFVTGAFAANNSLAILDKNQVIAQNDAVPADKEVSAPAAEESIFPDFVCVDSITYSLLPNDINNVIESEGEYSTYLTDTKAESIDKKNKVLRIWVTEITKWKGQSYFIENNGPKYEKYGYSKHLLVIDFKTKKYKYLTTTDYNCDGTIAGQGQTQWDYIVPKSVIGIIHDELKKKYKM